MTQKEHIDISITFRGKSGTEAWATAELWPDGEEPSYYDMPMPHEGQRRVLSDAWMYLFTHGADNTLSEHLYWGGPEESPKGFEDCNPLPDGSEVIVEEDADGNWEIVENDRLIDDIESAVKRLVVLEYEVVGHPEDTDDMHEALDCRAEIILADRDDQEAGSIEAAEVWQEATPDARLAAIDEELRLWREADEKARAAQQH